ncbi:hypothetical protein [Okeania sp.]|uniref:hypothetical protein n=1 Tax=Okeania sp. TaxID=3100323 RepID=UPI002B4B62A1|nr:hypothetical protein [Okeania sp.]MEB3341411.1 hypothetical protein [Okeania sp.]
MTSSPYKSKILNFIATKYSQILTRSDRVFNHLKFALTNTVQLLLYPIYVLVQTSRLAFKIVPQISQKVNKTISENHQTTEQPTQKLSVISKQAYPTLLKLLNPQPVVKRQSEVLSELDIPGNNKISDISATARPKNHSISETAKIEKKAPLLLQPCGEIVPMYGHLRQIWKIMSWVQTSKIALWFNLFNESSIALEPNEAKPKNKDYVHYQTLPLLSSANITFSEFIHNLHHQYLYPISRGLESNGLLPPLEIETEWELKSFPEIELSQKNQPKLLPTEDETSKIVSLVSQFKTNTFQIYTFLTTKSLINLRSSEKLEKVKNFSLEQHLSQQNKLTSTNNSTKKQESQFQDDLRQINERRNKEIPYNNMNSSKISVQTHNSKSRVKQEPDCLEIKSVPVGYVKHPLEIILGWVDLIMTWLEKIFVEVWQLCLQKLKKKNF